MILDKYKKNVNTAKGHKDLLEVFVNGSRWLTYTVVFIHVSALIRYTWCSTDLTMTPSKILRTGLRNLPAGYHHKSIVTR